MYCTREEPTLTIWTRSNRSLSPLWETLGSEFRAKVLQWGGGRRIPRRRSSIPPSITRIASNAAFEELSLDCAAHGHQPWDCLHWNHQSEGYLKGLEPL